MRHIETEDDWSGVTSSKEYDFIDVTGVQQQYKITQDQNLLL